MPAISLVDDPFAQEGEAGIDQRHRRIMGKKPASIGQCGWSGASAAGDGAAVKLQFSNSSSSSSECQTWFVLKKSDFFGNRISLRSRYSIASKLSSTICDCSS
ncbi:MAG: hypothetical protein H6667_05260 [Ardenticatenaceae bacterium]|nr:hypothetical protein [Ardenticatenaceae bacterium]